MNRGLSVFFLIGILFFPIVAQPAVNSGQLLQVPFYHDTWGSGPTAGMMVLAYLDAHGYPDLIPGDASQQTPAINDLIASPEHIADFAYPLDTPEQILPDRSEGAVPFTPDDSLANQMAASQSVWGFATGYTSLSMMWFGVERWAQAHHPGFQFDACYGHFCDTRMEFLGGQIPAGTVFAHVRASLDAGIPVVAVKGAFGDAGQASDDFVVIVGYEPGKNGLNQVAYLDPKDTEYTLHWGEFGPAQGTMSGFGAVLYFRPVGLED